MAKVQQDPHASWYLTDETAPNFVQLSSAGVPA